MSADRLGHSAQCLDGAGAIGAIDSQHSGEKVGLSEEGDPDDLLLAHAAGSRRPQEHADHRVESGAVVEDEDGWDGAPQPIPTFDPHVDAEREEEERRDAGRVDSGQAQTQSPPRQEEQSEKEIEARAESEEKKGESESAPA